MRLTWMMLAVVAAAAVYTKSAGTVVANGDPASDVLLQKNAFLPVDSPVCSQLKDAVESAATKAGDAGWPIKVAVIRSAYDLGTEPDYFGDPAGYANFLGGELGTYSTHLKRKLTGVPLLVVMPQGLALWKPRAAADPTMDARLGSVVDRIHPGSNASSNALARAALNATQKLAATAGHPIDPITVSACSGGGSSLSSILPFALPVLLLVLVGVMLRFRPKRA